MRRFVYETLIEQRKMLSHGRVVYSLVFTSVARWARLPQTTWVAGPLLKNLQFLIHSPSHIGYKAVRTVPHINLSPPANKHFTTGKRRTEKVASWNILDLVQCVNSVVSPRTHSFLFYAQASHAK